MTIDKNSETYVEIPGLPRILVCRVYRAEGWVRRFDVGKVRGVTETIVAGFLIDSGYTVDRAQQMVDAMGRLVFGPEDSETE